MRYSDLKLRKCEINDLDNIFDMQNIIIDELEDKSILRKNSRCMFETCIRYPNLTIGIYERNILIAVAIMADARGTEEDLSKDLVVHPVDIPANFKLVLVKKEYRGNGFQKALMWILERYAYLNGFTHLCTTVSENNFYSLKNVIDSKFLFDHNAIKYGGLKRKIYVKDIKRSVNIYNKMILQNIGSWEGKNEKNELVLEGINFDKCFQGDISIASTGDILEYQDNDSGFTIYGMLIKNFEERVAIYYPKRRKISVVDFSEEIDSLKLINIWINSNGGI